MSNTGYQQKEFVFSTHYIVRFLCMTFVFLWPILQVFYVDGMFNPLRNLSQHKSNVYIILKKEQYSLHNVIQFILVA